MSQFNGHNFLQFTLDNPTGIEQGSEQKLADGSRLIVHDSGILQIEPSNGKANIDLVLSCGVHGNETAPMELAQQMIADLIEGTLIAGVRILFLIGNPVAANMSQRFDQVNMNRLFSGAHRNYDCWEASRAADLEQAICDFFQQGGKGRQRLHYDLHTAIRESQHEKFAVHPFTDGKAYDEQQLAFLADCGLNAMLFSNKPTTTFSYYSYTSHGAQAFTLELGKVFPFGENDLSRFSQIDRALRQLIRDGSFRRANWQQQLQCFSVFHELLKDADDFKLHFSNSLKNFSTFTKDTLIADSSTGEYRAQIEGEAIVFPNANIPVGQRAALMLQRISPEQIQFD